jgi:hypothetical protein
VGLQKLPRTAVVRKAVRKKSRRMNRLLRLACSRTSKSSTGILITKVAQKVVTRMKRKRMAMVMDRESDVRLNECR